MKLDILINFIATAVIIILLIGFLFRQLTRRKDIPKKDANIDENKFTIKEMTIYIKNTLNEITNSNLYDLGLSEEEFKRRSNKRDELKKALKNCNNGNIDDKIYVKEFIFDLLSKTYGLNEKTINLVIPFDEEKNLTHQDKFDILLHLYKKKYQYDALKTLILQYKLDEPKTIIEDGITESFIITPEEITSIYKKEMRRPLTFEDKLQIIVQRIYAYYKGFGVIDEIRDMRIDGVSGGVSGIPSTINDVEDEMNLYEIMIRSKSKKYNNVWVFFKGKSIHLSFLSFEREYELRRVCQNIYKFNNPGQLSETKGYIVNEMADGSRVVVVRPPFSETWAFFVRKFDLPNATMDRLITDENSQLPINVIKFLMKGARITAITGDQGTGKTTLIMAMVKYIYAWLTLRTQEMAFELHLRDIYPDRNILALRETDSISGQEGLDVQKKTDGAVNILGEVATDAVATWMIQMSQVASLFTVFSHHARTFVELIFALRNSLTKTGMFHNEKIAELEVVRLIAFDIHLNKDYQGHRYIERITECIPLDQEEPYPEEWKNGANLNEKLEGFLETVTEYFRRKTDRKNFTYRNIVEYRDGKYVAVHPISEKNKIEMFKYLSPRDREEFQKFIVENWGENYVA